MCNFYSGIITRTGKCYSLGEIVSHEETVEKFKLKDKDGYFARWEIVPKKELGFLKPVGEKHWAFKLDESEKPGWWTKSKEEKCWKHFKDWFDSKHGKEFAKKFKKFKRLNKQNERLAKMSGEQIIHRTKLLPSHEKLIIQYYLLGEKQSWASVRASVWDSVRDSMWASVRASAWDSMWDSMWDSVWASVRASAWDSVWASAWDSVQNKPYPLALPKKIFDLGYIHCLIKEKDGTSKIHIYGKKGVLLKKIAFKDSKGKILIRKGEKKNGQGKIP